MLTFREQQEDLQENLAILALVKRIGGLLGFNFATIKLIFETAKILIKHTWLVPYIVDIFMVLLFFAQLVTHPLFKPSIYAVIAIYGGMKLHKLLKSYDKGKMTEDQLKAALKKYKPKKSDIERLRARLDSYEKGAKA